MTLLKNRYVNLAFRLLLGGLFIYAAWDKILHPRQFGMAIRAYQISPVSISNLFAVSLAWSEAFAGVMLIFGIFPRQAAGAVFLLLAVFVVALSTVLIRGMVIDCGCFKSGDHGTGSITPFLIVRNIFLLAAAWLVIQYNEGFLCAFAGRRKAAEI